MKVASDCMLNKIVQRLLSLICGHNHDDNYSGTEHNHDDKYSGIEHNHDGTYAPKENAIAYKDNSFNLNTKSYTADVNGKFHIVHVRTDEERPVDSFVCIDQRIIQDGEEIVVPVPGIVDCYLFFRRSSEGEFSFVTNGDIHIRSVTSYA